jgi:uncharacterized protein YcbK (DUF882 family)
MGAPNTPESAGGLSRRAFLTGSAAALAVTAVAHPASASILIKPRFLSLENLHTGEKVKAEYWAGRDYLADGLARIAQVLRDHRSNTVHAIDTKLLDTLFALREKLGVKSGFQVISGYRSPQSNAKLHAASEGVAVRSLHMDGKAIDIRVPGVQLAHVRDAAKSLGAGGVGFYAKSDFVHIDVGRVRYW